MSNDELQKAIDDITSGDGGASDGVSGGTGAPTGGGAVDASVLDDATAKQTEEAMNELEKMTGAAPAPVVGGDAFGAPMMPPINNGLTEEGAAANGAKMNDEPMGSMVLPPTPEATEAVPAVGGEEVKMPELSKDGPKDPELKEVEIAALLELYPLLEKMNVNAREKFDICVKVLEKTGEKGATSAALNAAKEITDEKEKGECLVKLVELIEGM